MQDLRRTGSDQRPRSGDTSSCFITPTPSDFGVLFYLWTCELDAVGPDTLSLKSCAYQSCHSRGKRAPSPRLPPWCSTSDGEIRHFLAASQTSTWLDVWHWFHSLVFRDDSVPSMWRCWFIPPLFHCCSYRPLTMLFITKFDQVWPFLLPFTVDFARQPKCHRICWSHFSEIDS